MKSMSTLLTDDDARDLLGDKLRVLRECTEDAFKRFGDERAEAGPVGWRARACLVHEFTSENAVKRLDGQPGIELIFRREDGSLRAIVFEGRAIVRFKKLARHSLTISATPTGEARAWARQQPLEQFPLATNLVVGYTLDDLDQIEGIYLVCSNGSHRLWFIDLDDIDGVTMPTFEFRPADPSTDGNQFTVTSDLDDDDAAEEEQDDQDRTGDA